MDAPKGKLVSDLIQAYKFIHEFAQTSFKQIAGESDTIPFTTAYDALAALTTANNFTPSSAEDCIKYLQSAGYKDQENINFEQFQELVWGGLTAIQGQL